MPVTILLKGDTMPENLPAITIPFNRPFIAGKELYYIAQTVMIESHLSGGGPFTRRCQGWLEEHLGCSRALLTHSCTAALEMAAILCDIGPGDEVIMPSFTFVSTANAFVLRGGVPVFVDIRPDTLNIDESLIPAAITGKTKAIVPVHYAGVACEMDSISAMAAQKGLYVVEDAAQAVFSAYKGRPLGSIGHLGCLSFHETKNVISGEGGALLINDERLIKRAEIVRDKGTNRSSFSRGEVDKYTWVDIGSSFLPGELIAAFLFGQLEAVEKITVARRRMLGVYRDLLGPLDEQGHLKLQRLPNDGVCNGHMCYILTENSEERTALIAHLRNHGVVAVFHYVPLHSSPAGLRYGRVSGEMSVTDDLSSRILRLPLYIGMTDGDIEKVVRLISAFYMRT
jgi:dTDP-4-amino-4,6-dideoxygalactose transaminase